MDKSLGYCGLKLVIWCPLSGLFLWCCGDMRFMYFALFGIFVIKLFGFVFIFFGFDFSDFCLLNFFGFLMR